jgi:ATP-binding cassette subfamily C (CFTR/MRP) protein 1
MTYLTFSNQSVRIETKAPIVSLFLDTVQGLITIRAFGWGPEFARRGHLLLNDSQKPLYLLFCVQRWLLLVLSLVAMALQVLVMGLAVALRKSVSPGLVGLAIVQVTTFSDVMSNLILQWTEMETSLGAVTRISRFTKETPQEAQAKDSTNLLDELRSSCSVTLEHVSASYE